MKFGELLKRVAIPEWRLCYLSYDTLKALIDLMKTAVQLKDKHKLLLSASDQRLLDTIILESNKRFFKFLREEVCLVFAFVQCKVIELSDRKARFQLIAESADKGNEVVLNAVESLYMEVSYLGNLIKVNIEGERKILKKHKKTMKKVGLQCPVKMGGIVQRLEPTIHELKEETEEIYVLKSLLQSKQARVNIRQLIHTESKSSTSSFLFGMGVGVGLSLIGVMVALIGYAHISIDTDLYFIRDFPVFRGVGLLLVYLWFFAINIYTFERKHVNYKLIFNITSSETSVQIFYRNSLLTAIYLILFLVWVIERVTQTNVIMPYLGGIAWLAVLTYFFMPTPSFNWRGRFFMLKLIGRSIISPIAGVDFPITWLTDQLVSLITCWKDLAYTICYYSVLDLSPQAEITAKNTCNSGANIYVVFFVGMFVYLYRSLQCIRQGIAARSYFCEPFFFNTIKYIVSLITLTLSFLYSSQNPLIFPAWCVFSVISTLYSYVWDLKMDWGLLAKNSRYRFLREELVYDSPVVYYLIMFVNFFLRLSWVLTFSPSIVASFLVRPIVFTLITGSLQVIRRALWNLLRVQKEHIANCVSLKATKQDQMASLLRPLDQTSSSIQQSSQLNDLLKEQRHQQLKHHLHKLIERKKKCSLELQEFVNQKTNQLGQIQKEAIH